MTRSARDRVLQDWARDVLHERPAACDGCGRRYVGVGRYETRWYRPGQHIPPYGDPVTWCECGRMLPS